MTEKDLQLTVPDGTVDAVLFTPEDGKPLPGVLFIPDIGSIRDTMRQMARRLAARRIYGADAESVLSDEQVAGLLVSSRSRAIRR